MKIILLFSMFILFCSMAESPQNEYLIRCDQSCYDDGDVRGVVIEGQCGCWSPKDILKTNARVLKGSGSYIRDKKTISWSIE